MLSNVSTNEGIMARRDMEHVALFTNPQGVYNKATGTWDPPPGHVWNGKYWYEPRKSDRKRTAAKVVTSAKASDKRAVKYRTKNEMDESSGDEADVKPRKKFKAAVKQAGGDKRQVASRTTEEERPNGRSSGTSRPNSGVCFHCDHLVTTHEHAPTLSDEGAERCLFGAAWA
ncbi:uncharacterized protein IUM83_18115 [Phytophthora cinnamomi]|uniref:uncharacterized protein n=1 Tax=Phytophthora cinnamomi TaxID=4785 RepID=UPI00355A0BBE|nr:hypothetical protein IUM83_18115 [Phytophthora cinnamomi]